MTVKRLTQTAVIPEELYVRRPADDLIRTVIREAGRPGYVLAARQMGKTNLLLRAVRTLQDETTCLVHIDLSTPLQTARDYFRLIVDTILEASPTVFETAGKTIRRLRDGEAATGLPPHMLHRRELLCLLDEGRLTKLAIVLDEIDGLAESDASDEVFSQIRATYFQRETFPPLQYLTYVLAGVSEPSELIKKQAISPFNISQHIYLEDFSELEFRQFLRQAELDLGTAVARRVYEWAKGSPRITWDICSQLEDDLAQDQKVDRGWVDETVARLYLSGDNNPPIDHVKNLVRGNARLLDSTLALKLRQGALLPKKAVSELYLAGVIGRVRADGEPRFRNLVLEKALSRGWLKRAERERDEVASDADVEQRPQEPKRERAPEVVQVAPAGSRTGFEALLREVFNAAPVSDESGYLNSAAYEMRRGFGLKSGPELRLVELGQYDGAEPYEHATLNGWLTAEAGLVFYVGEAGAGKTSLLRRLQLLGASGRAGGLAGKRSPSRHRLCVFDLLAIDPATFWKQRSDSSPVARLGEIVSLLAGLLHSALDQFLLGDTDAATARFELSEEALAASRMRGHLAVSTEAASRLLRRLRSRESNRGEWQEVLEDVRTYSGAGVQEQLLLALLPYLGLAWRMKRQSGTALLLTIDNGDHIPEEIQQGLFKALSAILSDAAWRESGLRLVVALRPENLSTSWIQQGSFSGTSSAVLPHYGPKPSEVVFNRATRFLLKPDSYRSYQSLNEHSRTEVVGRLLELWRHLARRDSSVYRSLDSLAGTNIRTAQRLASDWLLEARIDPRRWRGEGLSNLESRILPPLSRRVLAEMAESIARGFVAEPGALSSSSGRLRMGRAVLCSHGFVDGDPAGLRNSRSEIANAISHEVRNPSRLDEPAKTLAVPTQWVDIDGFARDGGVSRERLGSLIAETLAGVDSKLSILLGQGYRWEVITPSRQPPYRTPRARTLLSSFEATIALLGKRTRHAVNLFASESGVVRSSALRVLYTLRESPARSVRAAQLRLSLERQGYTREEMLEVITSLVRLDTRLLLTSPADESAWFDDSAARVRLSWSGRLYTDYLVRSAPYIQWALSDLGLVRREAQTHLVRRPRLRFEERMAVALSGLELLVEDEFARLRATAATEGEEQREIGLSELRCQSASADVFFRSLEEFMALIVLFLRSNRGGGGLAGIADKWLVQASGWLESHRRLFGTGNRAWEERYLLAKNHLETHGS